MYLSNYLFVFIYLFICIYLFIYLHIFIYLFVFCLLVFIHLYLSIYLFVFIYLFFCIYLLSICIYYLFICIYLFICGCVVFCRAHEGLVQMVEPRWCLGLHEQIGTCTEPLSPHFCTHVLRARMFRIGGATPVCASMTNIGPIIISNDQYNIQ